MYAACSTDYFSKELTGFIVGFWSLLFGIGSILSPVIAGRIADQTGSLEWSFALAIMTAIISVFLLLSVETLFQHGGILKFENQPYD